jgi:hypothetical protein
MSNIGSDLFSGELFADDLFSGELFADDLFSGELFADGLAEGELFADGLGAEEDSFTDCNMPITLEEDKINDWAHSIFMTLNDDNNNSVFKITCDVNLYVTLVLKEIIPRVNLFEFHANLVKPFSLSMEQRDCICAKVCSCVYDMHVRTGFHPFHLHYPNNMTNACKNRDDKMQYLRFATTHAANYFKNNISLN